jgi:hypothetical protein
VKVGFFPLDRQLKLIKHSWSPETVQHALRLAAEIPSFDRAAAAFRVLTHLPMSKSSLHHLSQEYGGRLVELQAAEAAAMVKPPAKFDEGPFRQVPQPDSEVMAVSLDGGMIHVRQEGWKEVKIAAVSAVEREEAEDAVTSEEPPVTLTHHSYRAGLWDAAAFSNQQWAEATRRGIEKARQVVSVNDGALWIWMIVAMCYLPCVQIIDWWHAVEKLWLIASVLFGEGNEVGGAWVERHKACLWAGDLRPLFHYMRTRYPHGALRPDGLAQPLGYFFHNRHRMHYAHFRRCGYPVGSGAVESACKVVVQARLKQAGMLWSRPGAQAMLALRSTILSDRWTEVWATISHPSKVA